MADFIETLRFFSPLLTPNSDVLRVEKLLAPFQCTVCSDRPDSDHFACFAEFTLHACTCAPPKSLRTSTFSHDFHISGSKIICEFGVVWYGPKKEWV